MTSHAEEEPIFDAELMALLEQEQEAVMMMSDRQKSLEAQSEHRFLSMDAASIRTAKQYTCKFARDKDPIVWKVLADDEHISSCDQFKTLKAREGPSIDRIDFEDKSIADNFFEHVWPDMKGSAKLLDEYYKDKRARIYKTYHSEGIRFHDPEAEDPDWKVKQFILIIIAAACEIEDGWDCWKSGQGPGRKRHPDFGQFASLNEVRCFVMAAAAIFSDRKLWYEDRKEMDILLPTIAKWNEKRTKMLEPYLLLLDESMVGRKKRTLKVDGLSDYTYEPRELLDHLGTIIRDSAECLTGVIMNIDPVMCPEKQSKKTYATMLNPLPNSKPGQPLPVHTAEALRQVEHSKVPTDGWAGGNAWFGSITTAVTLKRTRGVDSTWVVKNNLQLFPRSILFKILRTRYPKWPAGHWVVMTTEILGVPIIAVAYASSHSSVTYFVSTIGTTSPATTMYETKVVDEYGQSKVKKLPQPEIADFLFGYLPIIENHNRNRQQHLGLERKWSTKDCWFRLYTSLIAFSVTDLYRIYRYHDNKTWADVTIAQFADRLSVGLKIRQRKIFPKQLRESCAEGRLIRYAGRKRCREGTLEIRKSLTDNQRKGRHARQAGCAKQAPCFICRKYREKYRYTSFMCSECYTPICLSVDSFEPSEREGWSSCIDEHLNSPCEQIRCDGSTQKIRFPTNLKKV